MKTAEEYWKDNAEGDQPNTWTKYAFMHVIKQAQLDALLFCQSQIVPDGNPECAIEKIEKKIKELTARDNLKP